MRCEAFCNLSHDPLLVSVCGVVGAAISALALRHDRWIEGHWCVSPLTLLHAGWPVARVLVPDWRVTASAVSAAREEGAACSTKTVVDSGTYPEPPSAEVFFNGPLVARGVVRDREQPAYGIRAANSLSRRYH